ncbi:MAG: 3-keto-5-aminohexanoate cleavage protein [Gammaproteobacteria bacterium]
MRVGFENNLYRKDGRLAASNAELVAQACAGAGALHRPVATADTLRDMLICQ